MTRPVCSYGCNSGASESNLVEHACAVAWYGDVGSWGCASIHPVGCVPQWLVAACSVVARRPVLQDDSYAVGVRMRIRTCVFMVRYRTGTDAWQVSAAVVMNLRPSKSASVSMLPHHLLATSPLSG